MSRAAPRTKSALSRARAPGPPKDGWLRRPVRRPTSRPASALQRVLRAEAFFFRGNVQDAVRRGGGHSGVRARVCVRECVCAAALCAF
jgi:hypothetical protein